jgi:hypothetical protein
MLYSLYLYNKKHFEYVENQNEDMSYNENIKIDIVYTWVDGNDPKWKQKKEKATAGLAKQNYEDARYENMNELKYSLRSVFKYANWVNNIYIVVDDIQKPSFVNLEDPKIHIIKHSDIVDSRYLPLFNSVPIEACIHHIPGLSENFLYLNDDVFFGNYVSKKDIFNICYHEKHELFTSAEIDEREDEWICNLKHGYQLIKDVYYNAELIVPTHDPHFCKRSLMYEIENTWPDIYRNTLKQKVRKTNTDVKCNSICLPKMQYILGICKGVYTSILAQPKDHAYFEMFNQKEIGKFRDIGIIKPKFFCVNNNNSYSADLDNIYNKFFNFKCPYEI